eukprot:6492175-Amphidinium_carterae.2
MFLKLLDALAVAALIRILSSDERYVSLTVTEKGFKNIDVATALHTSTSLFCALGEGKLEECSTLGLLFNLAKAGWRHALMSSDYPAKNLRPHSPGKEKLFYTRTSDLVYKHNYFLCLLLGKEVKHCKSIAFYAQLLRSDQDRQRTKRPTRKLVDFLPVDEDDWDALEVAFQQQPKRLRARKRGAAQPSHAQPSQPNLDLAADVVDENQVTVHMGDIAVSAGDSTSAGAPLAAGPPPSGEPSDDSDTAESSSSSSTSSSSSSTSTSATSKKDKAVPEDDGDDQASEGKAVESQEHVSRSWKFLQPHPEVGLNRMTAVYTEGVRTGWEAGCRCPWHNTAKS